jgi:hypothetical protein
MHDFVGGGGEDVFDPSFHQAFIQIATASMSNRIVSGPPVHSDGISHNITVTTRPPGTKRFQIRVTSFEVNCYLLGCG